MELTERGSIRVLDRTAWQESRRRLEDLGGPPPADPAPRSDPILFGDKPEARGDGWKEKGFWDRAEAAYAEAIHARPLNGSLPGPAPLKRCSSKDFKQVAIVPTTTSPFHDKACAVGMLLQE